MEDNRSNGHAPLILGRPFLKTAKTMIDVHNGTLSMEFGGEKVSFNILDAMKHPIEEHSTLPVYSMEVLPNETHSPKEFCEFIYSSYYSSPPSLFDSFCEDSLIDCCIGIEKCHACKYIDEFLHLGSFHTIDDPAMTTSINSPIEESNYKLVDGIYEITPIESLPSITSPPNLELKSLPINLKYAFLEGVDQLPVIIANDLSLEQEMKLLDLLRECKKAIGWTLADIPGIIPSICMHRVLLEDEAKPVRQPQRRLNPTLLEVVKNEISKLLAARIIYPISDSKWLSPIQIMPKNTGFTVVHNDDNELVPIRIQNSWRVYIDYRKLNHFTRKDHFPLPFIDQMLERLAGKSHYCFLDGYSGYLQIHIAPEDQEKTTFTCPFGTFAYRRMPFGLCNAPGTFQHCMMSIFSEYLENCMEVFMDDFTVYGSSFDECLSSLGSILHRCIEKNLVLNYEKCHFMVQQGIVLGHVISRDGIQVDKSKVNIISSLPYPKNVRDIRSLLGHAGFYRRFIRDFSSIALPLSRLLTMEKEFVFDKNCEVDFNNLKRIL